MPEGPSIVILKELLTPYSGKVVQSADGSAAIDFKRLEGKKILAFKSWGKHTLICFKDVYVRIHLLMFGSYRINERREGMKPRLSLHLKGVEINFYTCQVKLMEGNPETDYDWKADVMSDEWSAGAASKKLKLLPETMVCDALLDQQIFSGSGNIIKNEVLFRIALHPESRLGALPPGKLKALVKEARDYSFDFYHWKKEGTLKKHWQIYKQKECPRCGIPAQKAYCGKQKRLTCFCENCQVLHV